MAHNKYSAMEEDVRERLEEHHIYSQSDASMPSTVSEGYNDAPASDAGYVESSSAFRASSPPSWNSNAVPSSDEGFGDGPSGDDPKRSQAELVNHRVSYVPERLRVAEATAFIGTALFTKRCRLTANETGHERRTILTESDFKKINEYTMVGPNLVEDEEGERYQLVILTDAELEIYTKLKARFENAISAGIKNAKAMSDCIFHPGSKLIHFEGFNIFMQLEHWGTLHNHLIKTGKITEDQCRYLFRRMVSVLEFMHRIGAVLRDISLRRWIFIDEAKTQLVLGTFVDMILLEDIDNDIQTERFGTPCNMAPEMVTGNIDSWAGRPMDVWSLGVNLFVMVTKKFPFADGTAQGLFRAIRYANYEFPQESYPAMTARVKELIQDILQKKPQDRPTAKQILQRAWFH